MLVIEPIICLVGPTASGKTELSLHIAQKLGNIEIIYADSMTLYKYLNIGTAKPTTEQRALIPHHLIDILEPTERWSSFRFRAEAIACMTAIRERKNLPMVVGGTGFYVKSLYQPLIAKGSPANANLRRVLERLTNLQLYARLQAIDPPRARHIGKNDRKRLVRALEIYIQTGIPPTSFEKSSQFAQSQHSQYILIGIFMNRSELKKRIHERTNKMFAEGLIQETQQLLDKGYPADVPALNNFTYRPIIQYIQGKISFSEARQRIITSTGQYLKRQDTWFRKVPVHWISTEGKNNDIICDEIIDWYLKMKSGG
jgi:tRNA dimethylallyltransferase